MAVAPNDVQTCAGLPGVLRVASVLCKHLRGGMIRVPRNVISHPHFAAKSKYFSESNKNGGCAMGPSISC